MSAIHERTPVAMVCHNGWIMTACDDGSMWMLEENGRWVEQAPIPGTLAAATHPAARDARNEARY